MIDITKKEEEIMQIFWKIKRGVVRDVIKEMEEPHPPYNTVSSMVRGLETKGYLNHKAYGKTHEYFPIVSKNNYRIHSLKKLITNYFDNSHKELVSFLLEKEDITDKERQEIETLIQNSKKENGSAH